MNHQQLSEIRERANLIEREPDYLKLINARIERLPKVEEAVS